MSPAPGSPENAPAANPREVETRCVIAGGGPAGMMLGFLLARAGVDTTVLEKHADFLRDFRGDTIHPSTMEIFYEVGLLGEFLKRPHQQMSEIGAQFGDFQIMVADFRHLPVHAKFIALMPQWDFLNFLAGQAARYPCFHLRMQAEVTALIEEDGCVMGVRAQTPEGELRVRASMVVGADGRRSVVRARAGLEVLDLGAPIDVLWMRLSRRPSDPSRTLGRLRAGLFFVTLDRGDYWQCAYVIRKGSLPAVQQRGLPVFRESVAEVAPFLRDRVEELSDWSQIKLLTVAVDRLREWSRPGLVCIGDAAHAMSPVGGVGINLAIQDAVAAANLLARPLLAGAVTPRLLRRLQRRRALPARIIQRLQVMAHLKVLSPTLDRKIQPFRLPLPMRLLGRYPVLRRIPARIIGLGIRPEHVHTPEVPAGPPSRFE